MIKKNSDIVMRKIHGSCFLIDISDKYVGNKCALYEINETGEFIWNSINDERNINEITNILVAAVVDEIDYEVVLSDVTEFINDLRRKGFLEVV